MMNFPLKEEGKRDTVKTHLIKPYRGLTSHGNAEKPEITAV